MKKIITTNAKETQRAGFSFARELMEEKQGKHAVVLGLQGDLGAGKTTFLQGFAEGLGIQEKILSPTFIVMKRFTLPKSEYENFFHFDCYRLEGSEDLEVLGFSEIVVDPKNIVAIEWSERVKKVMPKEAITISFAHLEGDNRQISIENF